MDSMASDGLEPRLFCFCMLSSAHMQKGDIQEGERLMQQAISMATERDYENLHLHNFVAQCVDVAAFDCAERCLRSAAGRGLRVEKLRSRLMSAHAMGTPMRSVKQSRCFEDVSRSLRGLWTGIQEPHYKFFLSFSGDKLSNEEKTSLAVARLVKLVLDPVSWCVWWGNEWYLECSNFDSGSSHITWRNAFSDEICVMSRGDQPRCAFACAKATSAKRAPVGAVVAPARRS